MATLCPGPPNRWPAIISRLEYYPTFDRRHSITLIEDYRLNDRWRLNLAFKFGSGQPYTEVTARYAVVDPSGNIHYESLDGKKNFYRLPAYHRLDIGAFYTTRFLSLPCEIYLQAVNVYNHKTYGIDGIWFIKSGANKRLHANTLSADRRRFGSFLGRCLTMKRCFMGLLLMVMPAVKIRRRRSFKRRSPSMAIFGEIVR